MKLSKSLLGAIFVGATFGSLAGCAPESTIEPDPAVVPNPVNVEQPIDAEIQVEIDQLENVEVIVPVNNELRNDDNCPGCGRG